MTASERLAAQVATYTTQELVAAARDLMANPARDEVHQITLDAITAELRARYPENPFTPTA